MIPLQIPAETAQRAMQIAQTIEEARGAPVGRPYTIARRVGCAACDPGACALCGYLFTGEVITVQHAQKGRRVLSDRAVHYLSHGVSRYETAYLVRGEPVIVDLDLEELASFLNL